jgi:pyrroline-5-carboxylate reductase
MNKKIGFIGAGNMGKAMIGGIVKSNLISPSNVIAYAPNAHKLNTLKNEFNIEIGSSAKHIAKIADIIVVAVKPNIYDEILEDIKEDLTKDKIIVTIAAGKSIQNIENILGEDCKIIRTMPNTPALVNEGMSSLCANEMVTNEELEEVKRIFESFGKAEVLPEHLIESVIGVSGSSPAYVFMFIEAMADGAVLGGMARDKAYKFAAQAVLGAAKMVLETGKNPGELKDMVCSPGGTTIEAVRTLEEKGLRSAVIEAMVNCMEKSKSMSKK